MSAISAEEATLLDLQILALEGAAAMSGAGYGIVGTEISFDGDSDHIRIVPSGYADPSSYGGYTAIRHRAAIEGFDMTAFKLGFRDELSRLKAVGQRQREDFQEQLVKLIDLGRSVGIETELLNPRVAMSKRLVKNALENHQIVAE